MFQSLKQALWLAKFELRLSFYGFITIFAFYVIYTILLILIFDTADKIGLFDLLFLILFTFVPIWGKPKPFNYQRVSGDLWTSPILYSQLQLPLNRKLIVNSRLLIHFFYSFPAQLFTLISLYVFSDHLQSQLSIGSFLSFVIFWLSFGIYIGYGILTTEAGDYTGNRKGKWVFFISLIITGLLVVFILLFPTIFGYGAVQLTIIAAQKWPVITSSLSILLAILGFYHWKNHMKQLINKTDYM